MKDGEILIEVKNGNINVRSNRPYSSKEIIETMATILWDTVQTKENGEKQKALAIATIGSLLAAGLTDGILDATDIPEILSCLERLNLGEIKMIRMNKDDIPEEVLKTLGLENKKEKSNITKKDWDAFVKDQLKGDEENGRNK